MNVISQLRKITVAAMAAMLSPLAASATPITIPNASFETPTSPTETPTNPNIISGWVFNVKGGSYYGTEAISGHFSSAGASSGNNAAFINNDDPSVTDTITISKMGRHRRGFRDQMTRDRIKAHGARRELGLRPNRVLRFDSFCGPFGSPCVPFGFRPRNENQNVDR